MRAWARRLAKRAAGDAGETLLELIVAITILGVCVVAIGSGIVLSVKVSSIHRGQATAQAFLHNYAEALQTAYVPCNSCASSPNYVASLPAPTGFNAPTASVKYWNGTAFTATPPATDPGLQRGALTLTSKDGFVDESLVVVLRNTT
jgi:hypothetical protein